VIRKVIAGLAVAGCATGAWVLTAGAEPVEKTTICHRTNSDNNPYVVNTPANEGVLNGHFEQHKGPIWEPGLKDQGIEWGDIIPPFPGHPEGLNWTTEGQAIFDNDCVPPNLPPPTTEPPTTTPGGNGGGGNGGTEPSGQAPAGAQVGAPTAASRPSAPSPATAVAAVPRSTG